MGRGEREGEVCVPVKMGCFVFSKTPPASSSELKRPPAWALQKKEELFVTNGIAARRTTTPSRRTPQHGYSAGSCK